MKEPLLTKPKFHPLLKAGLRVEIVEQNEFTAKVKLLNSKVKGTFEGQLSQIKGFEIKPKQKKAPVKVERIGESFKATVFYQSGAKSAILKNKLLAEDFLNAPPEKQKGWYKLPQLIRQYVRKHSKI